MSSFREHAFEGCVVRYFPDAQYLETVFPCGAKVPSAPNYDPGSIARAHALGYCGDTARMSFEHERAHSFLGVYLGHSYSPTLWHVAHEVKPPKGLFHDEECLVFSFQAYKQLGRRDRWLKVLEDAGLDVDWLVGEFFLISDELLGHWYPPTEEVDAA